MSSQMAVRSQNRTRRSLAEIKPEYDKELLSVEKKHKAYDRKADEYQAMRRQLRLANRHSRRAEQGGQLEELERWAREAAQLRNTAMPQFINNLERQYEELEKAELNVEKLRLEISLAAGIPDGYGSDIKVVDDVKRGGFNIYFGGIGCPDGVGHAHYAYGPNFDCRYRREPARTQPVPRWRR